MASGVGSLASQRHPRPHGTSGGSLSVRGGTANSIDFVCVTPVEQCYRIKTGNPL